MGGVLFGRAVRAVLIASFATGTAHCAADPQNTGQDHDVATQTARIQAPGTAWPHPTASDFGLNGGLHEGRDENRTRSQPRTPLGRRGVVRLADHGAPIAVVVLDLTRDGCCIEYDPDHNGPHDVGAQIAPGMTAQVGIANLGRIPATILWREATRFGCAFDQTLPPGAITAALGPGNVIPLPIDAAVPLRPINKLTPRARALVVVGACIAGWSVPVLALALLF